MGSDFCPQNPFIQLSLLTSTQKSRFRPSDAHVNTTAMSLDGGGLNETEKTSWRAILNGDAYETPPIGRRWIK